jgi:Domain of unknown function (DUF5667)
MKSPSERLNDRLERGEKHPLSGSELSRRFSLPTGALDPDPEVDELVTLARHLQASPQLQVDPSFARRLEGRLLQRHASLHQKQSRHRWSFPPLWGAHPAFALALGLCLLILLLGSGVLAVAAQVSNPENPLYAVKHWEQQVQVSLANSPESRAALDVQFARERLSALAGLAGPAHAQAYRQALADFDQQVSAAASAIQGLSSEADRTRLGSQLAALEGEARHTLRGLLPRLALAEALLTTDELGRLGETVPRLRSVEIALPAHPNEQATISITGDDVQPGAQLLVNGRVTNAQGFFQAGSYVFTTGWNGEQQPQSIGILNPDGTVAQTTAITLKSANGNGNGNSNNGAHGNGNGGGKPGKTPTPHH